MSAATVFTPPPCPVLPRLRCLSVRQPHAEMIMRGVKKFEYRSTGNRIAERIYIYASESMADLPYAEDDYGDDGLTLAQATILPRGRIIGTVEIEASPDGDWPLHSPQRLPPGNLPKPENKPQPKWFWPW